MEKLSKDTGNGMMKKFLLVILLIGFVVPLHAQSLGMSFFTITPEQAEKGKFYFNYESGYSVRAMRPFGEEGVEQRAGIVLGLTKRFSLWGVAGAVADKSTGMRFGSGQFELMGKILTQKKHGLNFSASVGYLREYLGTNVLMGRLAVSRTLRRFHVQGNAIFEKPFARYRDAVDVITTFAAGYHIRPTIWAGIDAIGEDLEGLVESDEAEGGAKFMIGPTVLFQVMPKMRVRVGGGPIFYLTQNTPVSQAPRVLPPGKSGYTVRISMIYGI